MTTKTLVIGSLVAVLGAAAVVQVIAGAPVVHSSSARVDGGAPSKEALIEEFLTALRDKNMDALRRLRVTENEFKTILMPGHVAVGEPLREIQPETLDFFWSSLSTKSFYYEQHLVHTYGGRSFTVLATEFETEPRKFASYTQFKQLRLTLREANEAGSEIELETGSIVEIDGRFKFASFVRD